MIKLIKCDGGIGFVCLLYILRFKGSNA